MGGSWGDLGASWGRLGGRLGGVLGRLWCLLRRLGTSCVLRVSLGVLGATRGVLGGVLGESWGRLGASWGASCGVLEPLGVSWLRLGCLRALLGLGGRLGGVLGSLGASWGRVLEASSVVLKQFHDVQTEWSDGFNLVGRAQRASERSVRRERSDQTFPHAPRLCQNFLFKKHFPFTCQDRFMLGGAFNR